LAYNSNPAKTRLHLYLFIVTLIYAATFTLAKWVMPTYIGAFGFILLRVATAALLLTATQSWFTKKKIPWRKEWKPLVICAIFGVAANMLMFFKGLSITHEINAAVMMLFAPIFVFIFSFILKTEKLYWWNVLGVLTASVGAMLFLGGAQFHFDKSTFIGDIFIILNAISYAFYLVFVRRLLKKYHPISVTRICFIIGFIIVFPFGIQELLEAKLTLMNGQQWFALLFVLIMATYVTYALNAVAVKKGGAGIVGSYIYLQPVLAALIAQYLGSDNITLIKAIYAAIIFFGVYLVSIKKYATN